MRKIDKQLALGLLVLVLAAGCVSDDKECEITCVDGFKTTQDGSCSGVNLVAFAQQHGGQCTAEEHQ
jgi:hypothetical protein